MDLPKHNSTYNEKEYWDNRYKNEEHYEWFAGYKPYRDILRSNIKTTDKILTLGCGNSNLSEEMYHDGFQLITNTDYSEIVIDNMRNKTKHLIEMKWSVKDIYALDYNDQSFEIVLEKGTLDALLVNEMDPWCISEKSLDNMHQILTSVSRILTPGGRFISITFAQPHHRLPIYGRGEYDWDVRCDTFGETFHFFVYTMTKGIKPTEDVRISTEKYFSKLHCLTHNEHENIQKEISVDIEKDDFVFKINDDIFT